MADNNSEPVAEQMLANEGATVTPWADTKQRLIDGGTYWLATIRPDGRPHVIPIGAVWMDDALYFTSGQGTQKRKNLAHDPHCVLTVSSPDYDLVVEGIAAPMRDEAKLERLAAIYAAPDNGWPATVRDGAFDAPFSAPTTGPAPYDVYEVTPRLAFALGTKEETVNGATRYRF